MNGVGGQAPAIAQELCKDWTDSHGHTHPGIYDEKSEDMKRWVESYPHAVPGCLQLVEPRKYRNAMFEAAKTLIPMGAIKFAPSCPKYDMLVLDDGTERKLSKNEQNSLIQMDLMKEEMVSMVRCKSPNGNITYQLPAEKKNKMHDDRNYCAMLSCWWIFQLRTDETFGDGVGIDYSVFFNRNKEKIEKSTDPWLKGMRGNLGTENKNKSPFIGPSPFKK